VLVVRAKRFQRHGAGRLQSNKRGESAVAARTEAGTPEHTAGRRGAHRTTRRPPHCTQSPSKTEL
jgi:hypothetical protein